MNSKLLDGEFRNWVRACLAQKCVRDAMILLVEKHCNDHYLNNNGEVMVKCKTNYTCNNCDVHKLEPFHKSKNVSCKYRKCGCKKKNIQPCPANGSCGAIYDLIKANHFYNDPNWSNTNCDRWSTSAWEQIKCFISTKGYKYKSDIKESDITAVVQICLNFVSLRTLFGADVGVLEKVRDIRNEICHSATLTVSNGDLKCYISHMTTCLKLNVFKDYKSEIDQQLQKLQDLENDDIEITNEAILAAVKDALQGLNELSGHSNCTASIIRRLLEVIESFVQTSNTQFEEIQKTLLAQGLIQKKILQVVSELKERGKQEKVKDKMSKVKSHEHKIRIKKRKIFRDEPVRPALKKFKVETQTPNVHVRHMEEMGKAVTTSECTDELPADWISRLCRTRETGLSYLVSGNFPSWRSDMLLSTRWVKQANGEQEHSCFLNTSNSANCTNPRHTHVPVADRKLN